MGIPFLFLACCSLNGIRLNIFSFEGIKQGIIINQTSHRWSVHGNTWWLIVGENIPTIIQQQKRPTAFRYFFPSWSKRNVGSKQELHVDDSNVCVFFMSLVGWTSSYCSNDIWKTYIDVTRNFPSVDRSQVTMNHSQRFNKGGDGSPPVSCLIRSNVNSHVNKTMIGLSCFLLQQLIQQKTLFFLLLVESRFW